MSKYRPRVFFKFLEENYPDGFYDWLRTNIAEYVLKCDERNKRTSLAITYGHGFAPVNQEGGIGDYIVQGKFISHCKMYVYDGSEDSVTWHNEMQPWFGVEFGDHATPDSNLQKVWLIADTFEAYLQEKKILYVRHNVEE